MNFLQKMKSALLPLVVTFGMLVFIAKVMNMHWIIDPVIAMASRFMAIF